MSRRCRCARCYFCRARIQLRLPLFRIRLSKRQALDLLSVLSGDGYSVLSADVPTCVSCRTRVSRNSNRNATHPVSRQAPISLRTMASLEQSSATSSTRRASKTDASCIGLNTLLTLSAFDDCQNNVSHLEEQSSAVAKGTRRLSVYFEC